MSINLTIDLYYIYLLSNARSLCGKQRSKQLPFLCSPEHYWRISHISLQRGVHTSRIRCKWTKSEAHSCSKHCSPLSHHGLHLGILRLSTSAPKGLTKVSPRMSRIKNTLNSVSKAVFGKQNEMISRLAQLKPSSRILRKVTRISCNGRRILYHWAPREAPVSDRKLSAEVGLKFLPDNTLKM